MTDSNPILTALGGLKPTLLEQEPPTQQPVQPSSPAPQVAFGAPTPIQPAAAGNNPAVNQQQTALTPPSFAKGVKITPPKVASTFIDKLAMKIVLGAKTSKAG